MRAAHAALIGCMRHDMASRTVQFFRIEVGIMPPDHQGDPITRSVLRRFSHFQKLQRMVCCSGAGPCQNMHITMQRRHLPRLRTPCRWQAVSVTATLSLRIIEAALQCTRTHS